MQELVADGPLSLPRWSKVKPSRTFPKSRVPEVLLPLVRIAVANTKHSERSPLGKEKWWQYKVSNPALKFEVMDSHDMGMDKTRALTAH